MQRSEIPEEIQLIGEIDAAAAPRIPRFFAAAPRIPYLISFVIWLQDGILKKKEKKIEKSPYWRHQLSQMELVYNQC